MGRFPRVTLVLIGMLVLLSGCSQQTMTQKSLSTAQVDKFVKEKGVTPVVVKNVGNSFTVIGFEDQSKIGYYAAAINKEGNVFSRGSIADNSSKVLPVWIGGSNSGVPFVTVIINDKKILDQADRIEVKFDDGYGVIQNVNSQRGIVISDDKVVNGNVKLGSVQILSNTGKILFEDRL